MNLISGGSAQAEENADQVYAVGGDPGDDALEDDHNAGPFGTEFSADRGNGGDTRSVEQAEDQKAHGRQRCQKGKQGIA